ncbi:hypothetical protein ACFWOG_16685 [Kitasatospora sp. NPDC058406]|uniref:hypothetical protein n=1 Tax=Kitasatospora sp. NPDC058406 TaxID=3346483 RepID=UPI003662EBC1
MAEVQPAPGGLQHIRRAVPRRRAARRGAWTGAAALAAVVSVLLPTLHDDEHLGLSGGPGSPNAHGGTASSTSSGTAPGGGIVWPSLPPAPDVSTPTSPGSPSGTAGTSPSAGASTTRPAAGTSAPAAATGTGGESGPMPLCTRGDLGQGTAQVGTADPDGRIYGYFTVTNTSAHSCRLGGPGSVTVTGTVGTESGRIRIADHTAGGPATGLPARSTDPAAGTGGGTDGLVLAPRAGYRVDFGWVPDAVGCPTPGGTTSPSASAGPGQSTTGGATGGSTGSATAGGTAGGGAAPGPGAGTGAAPGSAGGASGGAGTDAGAGASGGTGPGLLSAGPTGSTSGPRLSTGSAPEAGFTAGTSAEPPPSAATTPPSTGAPSPSATSTAGPGKPLTSVTLAYTPAPGNPPASVAVLPGVCAGTVYRTAPDPLPSALPAPSASPSSG